MFLSATATADVPSIEDQIGGCQCHIRVPVIFICIGIFSGPCISIKEILSTTDYIILSLVHLAHLNDQTLSGCHCHRKMTADGERFIEV